MEENTEFSSKLGWEILDLYGGKQQIIDHLMSPFYCNNNDDDSVFSDSLCFPIKDDASLPAATCRNLVMGSDDDVITTTEAIFSSPSSSAVCYGEMISFGLERQARESGDNCNKTSSISPTAEIIDGGGSLSSSAPSKRSRASYQNMQSPCCQVQGCGLDLKSAKDYHRRHRICEAHSKSPRVVVGGLVRRFCQQCSRFHDLSEFDDKKRSCRKRLWDHNARRRRPVTSLSSTLYDQRKAQSIVFDGLLNISSAPSLLSTTNSWSFNSNNNRVSVMNANVINDSSFERRRHWPLSNDECTTDSSSEIKYTYY